MLTSEQVRVLEALRVEYPESEGLAPRQMEDDFGVNALIVPIKDEQPSIDCGGECGREHIRYIVVVPDGTKVNAESNPLDALFGGGEAGIGTVSNTFGEAMDFGQPVWDNAHPVEAEDFPPMDSAIESDPWLGQDF